MIHSAHFLVCQKCGYVALWLTGKVGKMIQVTKGLKRLCRYPDLSIALCQDGEIGFLGQILQLDASS